MSRTPFIVVLIVIIAALGAYLFYAYPLRTGNPSYNTPGKMLSNKSGSDQGSNTSGGPQKTATAILGSVSDPNLSGSFKASSETGHFTVSVHVSKLPALAAGHSYGAWLKGMGSAMLYMGQLKKLEGDTFGSFNGNYVLGFQTDQDINSYSTVMVAEVKDGNPETAILQGMFQ